MEELMKKIRLGQSSTYKILCFKISLTQKKLEFTSNFQQIKQFKLKLQYYILNNGD